MGQGTRLGILRDSITFRIRFLIKCVLGVAECNRVRVTSQVPMTRRLAKSDDINVLGICKFDRTIKWVFLSVALSCGVGEGWR